MSGADHQPMSHQRKYHSGWSSFHSWIFIAIMVTGLIIIGIQNRYQYVTGSDGAIYRIAKLTGGMQQYDLIQGWMRVSESKIMPEPLEEGTSSTNQAKPFSLESFTKGNTITESQKPLLVQKEQEPLPAPQKPEKSVQNKQPIQQIQQPSTVEQPRSQESITEQTIPATPREPEMSDEEMFAKFKERNPYFGEQEFRLAKDDLYPDWKQNINPNGNWIEFLDTYEQFIQWWNDSGNPSESGMALWKKFMTSNSAQN